MPRFNWRISLVLLLGFPSHLAAQDRDASGRIRMDSSKPVPNKAEIVAAWQKRQDAVRTARFAWTEQQSMPKGWIANPRFPERERLLIPALVRDRRYPISKTLDVDANQMRYTFEIDRLEEPDSVAAFAPVHVASANLGVRRKYTYTSTFDGQIGRVVVSSLLDSPPPTTLEAPTNVDAQNLDTRPILLAIRPLDPIMGLRLLDRAVPNQARAFYDGRSTMILEERHDPAGWKTLVWIEPERDFLISRFAVAFEQKIMAEIDIEYVDDSKWGWIPSTWRITEILADGSKRLVTEAKVSNYSINAVEIR